MAYQTGAGLTDITELLNQLRIFLLANGYSEHEFNQNGIDWTGNPATSTTLVMSKNGVYFYFWTDYLGLSGGSWGGDALASIFIKHGTGYTPGNNPFMHPGSWGASYNDAYNGTVLNACGLGTVERYYFFLDGGEITVVFQTNAGVWRTFSFGEVNTKLTIFAGGAYCMGDYMGTWGDGATDALSVTSYRYFDKGHSTYGTVQAGGGVIRADLDTAPQYHHGGYVEYFGMNDSRDPTGGDMSTGEVMHMSSNRFPYALIEGGKLIRGANNYGLVSHMQPINMWVRRLGNRMMLAARLSSMMLTNIKHYAAGQEEILGADTWVVFPTSVKTPSQNSSGILNSWYFGHAVKKVI